MWSNSPPSTSKLDSMPVAITNLCIDIILVVKGKRFDNLKFDCKVKSWLKLLKIEFEFF
jgi:hypothetical protein